MTRYALKSVLGNNVSDVRLVQALMKDQDIYYGPCDGVMTPYMANSLARFNKTGFANEKVGDLHILKPNGSTLTNLGKRASGDYADMKSLVNLSEVISCKDDDWKLDIISADKMPFEKVEGKTNPIATALHKVLSDMWKEYYLPFRLEEDDFSQNENGQLQFILRFPPLKWLQSDCNFTDNTPKEIIRIILEKLAAIGFQTEEKNGSFIAIDVENTNLLSRGEHRKQRAKHKVLNPKVIFSHPTMKYGQRGIDNFGNGAFGASRDGGSRPHEGTDYLAIKGQNVYAVISGTVSKIGYAYGNDLSYRIIDVTGKQGHVVRHFYTAPLASITKGTIVESRDIIGNYQSLDRRYRGITEHVHIEIRKNGVLINPTTLIP